MKNFLIALTVISSLPLLSYDQARADFAERREKAEKTLIGGPLYKDYAAAKCSVLTLSDEAQYVVAFWQKLIGAAEVLTGAILLEPIAVADGIGRFAAGKCAGLLALDDFAAMPASKGIQAIGSVYESMIQKNEAPTGQPNPAPTEAATAGK